MRRPTRWTEEAVCVCLLEAGALTVRDVDAGEEPFLYSSGSRGPGYVMVKGLVARQATFRPLAEQLALRLLEGGARFDHVAGNATGGMIPAYAVREAYQSITGRDDVEYVYIRGSRKVGGHGELVTGLEHLAAPAAWLVVEDLVNYAETPVNSLLLLRSLGFEARETAAVMTFDQPEAVTRLRENGVRLTTLTTVRTLLDVAVGTGFGAADAVASYRDWLGDPAGWQRARGLIA